MAEHNTLGKWGEDITADYLVKEGYAIVERNWHMNKLEIDIIASKGNIIAFVEVKTRRSVTGMDPLKAMTPSKIRYLVSAANGYLRMSRTPLRPRFDVATIVGDDHGYTFEYIADAFRPPLRTYR